MKTFSRATPNAQHKQSKAGEKLTQYFKVLKQLENSILMKEEYLKTRCTLSKKAKSWIKSLLLVLIKHSIKDGVALPLEEVYSNINNDEDLDYLYLPCRNLVIGSA